VLRWRVLTALILVPLALLVVWAAPRQALGIVVAGVLLLAAWEWTRLIVLESTAARIVFLAAVAAAIVLEWAYLRAGWPPLILLAAALVWWGVAGAWLRRFSRRPEQGPPPMGARLLAGVVLCALPWYSVLYLQAQGVHGPYWVTLLFLLVWGADTGAYFAGRAFGRRRLAPSISPGKTWAGVGGGLVIGVGLVAVYAWLGASAGFGPGRVHWPWLLTAAVAAVLCSVAGDLFESMVKRQHGVKDSGGILPGHGGILDRIDGMIAAAPVIALGVYGGL